MEFLKNKETGQILHYNKVLAKMDVMVPCDPPVFEDDKKIETTESDEDLIDKEKGAALVKKWFSRDISRVTKQDLIDHAAESFGLGLDDSMSKPEMITKMFIGEQAQEKIAEE